MNLNKKIIICLIIASFILPAGQALAQGIKERMRARLPVILALKADGVVGENNKGFLTVLKSTDKQAVVDAENQDRRKVYSMIAKRERTSPQVVGQRVAKKKAERAKPGTMIQGPDGKWYRK